jgi:large subunit ribosomal protein L32
VAVPKRKTTRSRRDMRRAHHDKVTAPNVIACPNCGDMMMPHRVCPACGHYKGRKVTAGKDEGQAESGTSS